MSVFGSIIGGLTSALGYPETGSAITNSSTLNSLGESLGNGGLASVLQTGATYLLTNEQLRQQEKAEEKANQNEKLGLLLQLAKLKDAQASGGGGGGGPDRGAQRAQVYGNMAQQSQAGLAQLGSALGALRSR